MRQLPDAVVTGNQRSEFTYDGFSRRTKIVEKVSGTVTGTKQFVWVGGEIAEERDGSNVVQKKFFGLGEWRNGVGNLYYARDHLGNLREMTDGTNVRARYEYDPYGRRTKVSGDLEADWGFTGHYYHAPSTLHLAWFRAYDANLGRWISRDPIGELGGLNVYGYVEGNPVNFRDSLGLSPAGDFVRNSWTAGLMGAGAILGFIGGGGSGLLTGPGAVVASPAGAIAGAGVGAAAGAAVGHFIGDWLANMIDGGTGSPCPNPHGSKGKPDHQDKVDELDEKAQGEKQPGENVLRERKIQGHDSNRRPDVQIVDREGKARKIFEAERYPNRARNINREKEYNDLGIENQTFPLD